MAVHGRDLYLLKPTLGPPKKFQHLTRTEEVVITQLRIGHTKATKSHILSRGPPTTCHHCGQTLDYWPYAPGVCSVTGKSWWILHSWLIEYSLWDNSCDFCITPSRYKQDLPFAFWLESFNIFIAIYVQTVRSSSQAIHLTQELLTYKQTISNLFKNNHNWGGYDRHYRQECENNPHPRSQLRPDLHLQYSVSSPKEHFRSACPLPTPTQSLQTYRPTASTLNLLTGAHGQPSTDQEVCNNGAEGDS